MSNGQDFLIEIGVEELPTRCVPQLAQAFAKQLLAQIATAQLTHTDIDIFTTPRRIAVCVHDLLTEQPTREIVKRGPAIANAYDAAGNPTQAAIGFARSCGVEVAELARRADDKGDWLIVQQTLPGQATRDLIPTLLRDAIAALPLPKRMRWGAGNEEFIRPVHWICCLLGSDVVPLTLFGIESSNTTRGHRFHAPEPLLLKQPRDYESVLREQGRVVANWQVRRKIIVDAIHEAASLHAANALLPEALVDEVTNLVEWPVVLVDAFDETFLKTPREVLCAVMNDHQKCFALADKNDKLIAKFILVSNIESKEPQRLIAGNQRVMRARMADGAFFYEADCKKKPQQRVDDLKHVLYVRELGTLHDKAQRLAQTSRWIAQQLGEDEDAAQQAGLLAKTDLLTDMVGEFPELQGVMGYYYATRAGLTEQIAVAIRDQYLPAGRGNVRLPETNLAACLAIADKMDTLVGIFGINKQPSGEKDPFATRRAAVGIIRIIIDGQLEFDLQALIETAMTSYQGKLKNQDTAQQVLDFIYDRLRAWYQDKDISVDTLSAVLAKHPSSLLDCDQRVLAVHLFRQMPEASALAAANKRVSRLLMKEDSIEVDGELNSNLFDSPQETQLADALAEKAVTVAPFLQRHDYTQALRELSSLQQVVDNFFDHVMVMADDEGKRKNRLALLAKLRKLFLEVADISLLQ